MYRYHRHTVREMSVSSPYNYLNIYDVSEVIFSASHLKYSFGSNTDREYYQDRCDSDYGRKWKSLRLKTGVYVEI